MEPLAITAMVNLMSAAGKLATGLRDDWYEVSAELVTYKSKVDVLREKSEHWENMRRQYGMVDNEKVLTDLAKDALVYVQKEINKVQKMESRRSKVKQRAFPGQLTSKLDSIEKIVDAGLTVLRHRVESFALAERSFNYHSTPLPFGADQKYVLVVQSVDDVKAALEKEASGVHEIRVVTVYGEPGTGKTCLLKHLALHYESAKKTQADESESKIFPDGVVYLSCGSGDPVSSIKKLRLKLTQSFGFGSEEAASRVRKDGITEVQGVTIPDYNMQVLLKIKYKKVLIILDDIWHREVLEKVLIPGNAVTYLVSCQDSQIWDDAVKICMKYPTRDEARKIMATYIKKSAKDAEPAENAELPDNIRDIADEFISELHFHPLALAQVGLVIGLGHADDPGQWIRLRTSWQDELLKESRRKPAAFGETYQMSIPQTMNRMVESLLDSERSLLFLICLFEENTVPDVVVRRYRKHLEPKESEYDYSQCRETLQEKCLIEVLSYEDRGRSNPGGDSCHAWEEELVIHGIRASCIKKERGEQLRSMVKQLLESTSGDGAEGHAPDWAQRLRTAVMRSMFVSNTFWDVVTTILQRLLGRPLGRLGVMMNHPAVDENQGSQQVLDNAITGAMYLSQSFWPRDVATTKVHMLLRSVNVDLPKDLRSMDVIELMERAGDKRAQLEGLVVLLYLRGEGPSHARKIILKFICRTELDDASTARLIKLPYATSAICDTLERIFAHGYWSSKFVYDKTTFSSGHAETTESLLSVLTDNQTTTNIRQSVLSVFRGGESICPVPGSSVYFHRLFRAGVLDYECGNSILNAGRALMNHLAKETWSLPIRDILDPRKRASVLMYSVPALWKVLMLRKSSQESPSSSDNAAPLRLHDGQSCAQSYAQVVEHVATSSDPMPVSDCLSTIHHLLEWRLNHTSAIMEDAEFLNIFCNTAATIVGYFHQDNQDEDWCPGQALKILDELCGIPENRELIWANRCFRDNFEHILKWGTDLSGYALGVRGKAKADGCGLVLAGPEGGLQPADEDDYLRIDSGRYHAVSILGHLGLSETVRDSLVSFFPNLEEKLRSLQDHVFAHYRSLQTAGKEQFADLVRKISKVRTILDPVRVYSQDETTNASPLSEHILLGMFDAYHEMKMYDKANVYVDMKSEDGLLLLPIPTSLAVYVKAMSGDYKGAMECPLTVRSDTGKLTNEDILKLAENLGEKGVLQRLPGGNLIEAREYFDQSFSLINSLSPEFLSENLRLCSNLMYRLFQQRGFVKYKLKDIRGARDDAVAAQELESRTLVWRSLQSLCEPTSLLALPTTYLDYTFIQGYGPIQAYDKFILNSVSDPDDRRYRKIGVILF